MNFISYNKYLNKYNNLKVNNEVNLPVDKSSKRIINMVIYFKEFEFHGANNRLLSWTCESNKMNSKYNYTSLHIQGISGTNDYNNQYYKGNNDNNFVTTLIKKCKTEINLFAILNLNNSINELNYLEENNGNINIDNFNNYHKNRYLNIFPSSLISSSTSLLRLSKSFIELIEYLNTIDVLLCVNTLGDPQTHLLLIAAYISGHPLVLLDLPNIPPPLNWIDPIIPLIHAFVV
jgi:hypothetical protein